MSKVESAQVVNPSGITDESAHITLTDSQKYFFLEELQELGKHTLAFYVKGKTSGDMTVAYQDDSKDIAITTDWQRVIFPFTATEMENPWIYFSGDEYWIYNAKLESGDFATGYDKNQADIESTVETYHKETSAEIVLTKESIMQSVTSLEETVKSDYYTKTEAETLVSQTKDGILQTVSSYNYATQTYADTAAGNAKTAAISDTEMKLQSYSTTTQMNTAINQKADSITSTVNTQITETRTYADTAAGNAKTDAISDTTEKLKSYSTTTQMNTAITQSKDSILQTVSTTYTTKSDFDDGIDSVETYISTVEQTATKINWVVKSGTSSSDFTLTDRTATLVANYINLKGLIEFSGLDSDTQDDIEEAQSTATAAKTAAASAQSTADSASSTATTAKNKLDTWSSSGDTTLIDGGKIYTGSITADKLSVTDLYAINATIGGFTIAEKRLYTKRTTSSGSEYSTNLWSRDTSNNYVFTTSYTVGDTNYYLNIYDDCSMAIYGAKSGYSLKVSGKTVISNSGSTALSITGDVSISGDLSITGDIKTTLGGLSVYDSVTMSKNATISGILTAKGNVKLCDSTSDTLSFFGATAVSRKTVSKISSTSTATTSTIATKVNDLITALNNYGLIGI